MNFLFLNQFYPPDRAPTGQYLHDLARTLVALGHRVTVITSSGGYEAGGTIASSGVIDGVAVLRVPALSFGRGRALGRLADYASYVLLAMRRGALLKPAPDLVLSLTTPPFLGVIGRWIARRHGCPHAHWVMDVYPDALAVAGALHPRSSVYRSLAWLARRQWRDAHLVLALGPCMAERLEPYRAGRHLPWVPLWTLPSAQGRATAADIAALRHARGWDGCWVVAYTGNLGRGHDLEGLFRALGHTAPVGRSTASVATTLVLALPDTPAGQAAAGRARQAAPGLRVDCMAHASDHQLAAHLAAPDLQVVAVRLGWEGVVVPSKLQGVMAAGRPTLVLAAVRSEAAQWVAAAGAGWCAEPDDVPGISAALLAAADAAERERRGHAAQTWAQQVFAAEQGTRRVAWLCVAAAQRAHRTGAV